MKPAVLQLIDSFNQGGSERQALQLTRLLAGSDKYEVHLASLSPEGSLRPGVEDLDLAEIPSFPLNSFYDANAVKQLRRLIHWLKSSHIQIIHTHDFYTNVFGMAAAALARLPVRVASMRETAGMRSATQKKVQQVAYSLSHQIVANSEAVRSTLVSEGIPADKITVVYNGLDAARLVPQASSRAEALSLFDIEEERRIISIVANMRHEVKDYPMLLRSARQVLDAEPAAAFLLAGEGELTDSLRALAVELGIQDSIYFLGRCECIADLLSISEICVLSSKAEGFSNSILEYMAAGRPVVVTNVGGAAEIVSEGETGYLVSSGDDATMAARIIWLLRHPDRAVDMGMNGLRVVTEKFSCAAQLSRTESLYERLLLKT